MAAVVYGSIEKTMKVTDALWACELHKLVSLCIVWACELQQAEMLWRYI